MAGNGIAGSDRRRRGGLGFLLMALTLAAAAGAGVWAGARWHDRVEALLGAGADPAAHDAHDHGSHGDDAKSLWTCSMHPQVIREEPGRCPICHMELTPLKADAQPPASASNTTPPTPPTTPGEGRTVKYWWDPMMNPPYISAGPGKSPMGMDLVPVYEDGDAGARVVIDPAVIQTMGVRVAEARVGPVTGRTRMVGFLEEAQPLAHEVNPRVSGWVRHLRADTEGMRIEAGEPLFDIYSPELQVAIEELISTRRARDEAGLDSGDQTHSAADSLLSAAMRKLELLGLPRSQVEALARLDRAPDEVTILSPGSGVLTEKPIVEGSAIEAGARALRIVDYSTLWLDARVFEKDLPMLREGQRVVARIGAGAAGLAEGTVEFLDPRVDPATRTALVRMAIKNPLAALRPGMYATVWAEALLAERAVLIPREAIIDTGERRIVFLALEGGAFAPREVEVGHVTGAWAGPSEEGGMAQILRGVSAGERVVVSGQFLLDSESNLREAIRKFLNRNQDTPTTRPVPGTEARSALDRVFDAYLTISAALGRPESPSTRVETTPLAEAAREFALASMSDPPRAAAKEVERAAGAMAGHPLEHQRAAFKALSEAMIALAALAAPSPEVGAGVVVVNCAMAPGRWLQRGAEVANPYYATAMKSCGEVVGPVRTNTGVSP